MSVKAECDLISAILTAISKCQKTRFPLKSSMHHSDQDKRQILLSKTRDQEDSKSAKDRLFVAEFYLRPEETKNNGFPSAAPPLAADSE